MRLNPKRSNATTSIAFRCARGLALAAEGDHGHAARAGQRVQVLHLREVREGLQGPGLNVRLDEAVVRAVEHRHLTRAVGRPPDRQLLAAFRRCKYQQQCYSTLKFEELLNIFRTSAEQNEGTLSDLSRTP